MPIPPVVKIKSVRLDLLEVRLENNRVIEYVPKAVVLAPELIEVVMQFLQDLADKHPEDCKIIPSEVLSEEISKSENDQTISKILDLVDVEGKNE